MEFYSRYLLILSLFLISNFGSVLPHKNDNPLFLPKSAGGPIKIGFVSCVLRKWKLRSQDIFQQEIVTETVTLLKSLVISAYLNNIESLEFHAFFDSRFIKEHIEKTFHQLEETFPSVKIKFKSYYVWENFPFMSHFNELVAHSQCQFMRLFFPHTLPKLDKILYLDSDILVTGNIQKLWDYYDVMDENQICAVAPNNELEDANYGELDKDCFGGMPHVPPKGLNSGVMLMNLDKMREVGWLEKMLDIFDFWRDKWQKKEKYHLINDQQMVNVYFHSYPDKLKFLPCHFNFMHVHCDLGLTCKSGLNDPFGIHLVHGAASKFHLPESPFHHLFQSYIQFNMTKKEATKDNIVNGFYLPNKIYYSHFNSSRTCFKSISSLLYKQYK